MLMYRGVRLAKNDFGSVFSSVFQKTAVFGAVSVLLNYPRFRFLVTIFFAPCVA